MKVREFTRAHAITKLQKEFQSLIQLDDTCDDGSNGNDHDDSNSDSDVDGDDGVYSSLSTYSTLKSILKTLNKHHHYYLKQNNESDDDDCHENSSNNFIRTNLANYNRRRSSTKQNQRSTEHQQQYKDQNDMSIDEGVTNSDHVSLRAILESKSCITKFLQTLVKIMSYTNHSSYSNDDDGSNNDLPLSSIIACHVYAHICLLPGSWSAGWIDLVAMRYVETILRKWNVFCSEYKMILDKDYDDDDIDANDSCNDLRMKRSRLSKNEKYSSNMSSSINSKKNNEKNVFEKIQFGIELSKTLTCILLQVDDKSTSTLWDWNIEAREALFDSTILALSTCSALLTNMNSRQQKSMRIFCENTVLDICRALESVIISSVEEEQSSIQRSHDHVQIDENDFNSPNRVTNGKDYLSTPSSTAKKTVISILRNIYPILTYQIDLPNGLKGKQAAFDRCQSILANLVRNISCKLKSTTRICTDESQCFTIDTHKKTEKLNINVMTPLTGRKGTKRLSITPKSTNRKKLHHIRDGVNSSLLAIPPSLKKSVTPKRSSHRKSMLLQQQYSASKTMTKSTQKKKRKEMKELRMKELLELFVAMMQKLSTGRNMDRVEVRTRISKVITHLLENMKVQHRIVVVSFVIRLCSSKVSSHRIFGVELLSSILAMDWVWEDNLNCYVGNKRRQQFSDNVEIISNDNQEVDKDEEVRTNSDVVRRRTNSTEFPRNQSISFLVSEQCKASQTNQRNHISREILTALHGRVMDRSPAVRARVAIALSTAFRDINKLVGKSDEKLKILNESMEYIGPNLISSLRERAKSDQKATVRKATLLAFVDLLLINVSDDENEENNISPFKITQNDVNVLCELCNDMSVSVRKAAVDSLVSFIERQHFYCETDLKYESGSLEIAWVNFILPLVRDVEPSCVSKIVESFETLIVAPILEMSDPIEKSDNSLMTRRYKSAWRMLSKLNHESFSTGASAGTKNALKIVMRKAFEVLDARQRKRICIALLKESHCVITSHNYRHEGDISETFIGGWCLLESLGCLASPLKTKSLINLKSVINESGIGIDFLTQSCLSLLEICDQENIIERKEALIVSSRSCLHTISSFACVMDNDQIKKLALGLKEFTKSFNLVLELIGPSTSAMVSLATAICRGKPEFTIGSTCSDWIKEILYKCEANLNMYVSSDSDQVDIDDSTLSRVIFTTGEICLIGFKQDNDCSDTSSMTKKPSKKNMSNLINAINARPSNRLIRLVQSLLPLTLPTANGTRGKEVSHVLRAHAFIAYGKMCLREESLARDGLHIFAQEIGSQSNEAVRSNALLVLGDLCVCYTHLVDKFIPFMATCLQPQVNCGEESDSSIVQQHAIILFSNLLLQDYIKWKGLLFYRFAAAAVSKDPIVSHLAKSLLCGPLLLKQPNLFSNHFIDTLYILNGCKSHPIYTAQSTFGAHEDISNTTTALKIKEFDERLKIYNLLLSHLRDEEKIGVTARLAKDILKSATECSGCLSQAASAHGGVQSEINSALHGAYCVLFDCLSILTNPRLLVGKSRQSDLSEEQDVNVTMTSFGPNASQLSSVKGRLLSKISRKHMIETVLPILCNLKVILERSRSPLLKNLMEYLVCIFRQFKHEVNEVLASDPTLLQEIQYDTRQFEKNQDTENSNDFGEVKL